MAAEDSKALKSAALIVAIVFASCVVCGASGYWLFGSSKVRPLFGMSADALAGGKQGPPQGLTKKPAKEMKEMKDLTLDGGY